jgi:hypothetical protein
VLDISKDELDPETIVSLLRTQLPNNLHEIVLRYLDYEPQTKIMLGQLALLKMQGIFPALTSVRLNFQQSRPASFGYMMASFVASGPTATGGFAAGTAWEALPDAKARVHEDLDKLYVDAGILMEVEQTDY